jgi:LuxR family maltose regulon positive regulatory protein
VGAPEGDARPPAPLVRLRAGGRPGARPPGGRDGLRKDDHPDRGIRRRALEAKLRPPSFGARHTARRRLSEEFLDRGLTRLTLVSAPAGSGKTTLLSEWFLALQDRRIAAAWLSLDPLDNDPRRFLLHLVSAIRTARTDIGREAMAYLTANPDALVEDIVESVVHDFGETNAPIAVFLDDYHEIRDRTVHAAAEFLVRYSPDNVRFVVGTRKDPPLSIERLRVRGEVRELRWEELRFTLDEVRDYLREACGLELSDGQVRAFRLRTEGWIAGLQLAAVAMAGPEDADRLASSFTGAQRKVADYLLSAAFLRQPAGVRDFLVRTSILDRLTAPLCDALTGRNDGRLMFETLERGNLFLFGLDDDRTWYRYHQLFAEFLRSRLRAGPPEEVCALYDRASEWHERNGFPAEAVRYAIDGNRFDRAARLLETAGREMFRRGDFKELRRWIGALPDGTVRKSPSLCVLHAWALGYLGELDAAGDRVACAEREIAKSRPPRSSGTTPATTPVEAELRVLRAVLGIIRTDEPDAAGLYPGIASRFPREESALRAYASVTLGFAARVGGDLPLALRHFRKALKESELADSSLVNLNARLNIGVVQHLMGRTNAAEESFRDSLEVSRERRWTRTLGAAFLRYGLALVLHEKNRLGEALTELSQAIEYLEAGDAFGFLGIALLERARTQFALGKTGLAAADLAQAREIAAGRNVERVAFRADLLSARMAVLAQDPDRAEAFLEAAREAVSGRRTPAGAPFSEKYESYLAERIRLLVFRGRHEEALRLAGSALRSAGSAGRGRNEIEFLVLQSAARAGASGGGNAVEPLAQALRMAQGEGIVTPFLSVGKGIVPALRRLKGSGEVRRAAAGILSALEADAGARGAGILPEGAPDESFHHREVQILELISRGLRNREIGKRLFLSEETVKWYLKRLYCKLHVGTRTEAVATARKLGLIP